MSPFLNRSVDLLGMTGSRGFTRIQSNTDFIPVIRDGVPKRALDHLMKITGITAVEIEQIIKTSGRTLRRYTATQKLNPEQSERVIELARLYSRGEEVFGSIDTFKEWMDHTIIALGNQKPKTYLDTSLGIDLLMDELGRIENGILA